MGGPGSGGNGRISDDQHRLRGTYRPGRHARIGKLIPLPSALPAHVPDPPDDLGTAGRGLWILLWSTALWLTPLDIELVRDVCNAADDLAIARRRYAATTEAQDGRAVESAVRTKSRLLILLGVSPKDRASLGLQKIEAVSKLDAMRRRKRP
jgi:hypothetical protein